MVKNFFDESQINRWTPKEKPENIFDSECEWPYSIVDFDADFKKMHDEVCLLEKTFFIKHRDKDKLNSYYHEGWNAVTLHGIDPHKTENYDRYGFSSEEEANYRWTEVCEYLPTVTDFVKSLGYSKYGRVRIMKLEAGGYIMPHTDGKGRIFGPFNIAINNPDGCLFSFKNDGIVPFKQGRGAFLDLGREHSVWNNSDEDRYHLIVHGHINPDLIQQSIIQTFSHYGQN